MSDGSVSISVDMDDKEAKKKLAEIEKSIKKTQNTIDKKSEQRSGIQTALEDAQRQAEETQRAIEETKAEMEGYTSRVNTADPTITAEARAAEIEAQTQRVKKLAELEAKYSAIQAKVQGLTTQEQTVTTELTQQEAILARQEGAAGQLSAQLAQAAHAEEIKQKFAEMGAKIKESAKGLFDMRKAASGLGGTLKKALRGILAVGLGVQGAVAIFKKLKQVTIEAVKAFAENDSETRETINGLKANLATLKASWGAAFAPIVQAVAPMINSLIKMLTSAAEAVARFIAVLSGKGAYKKAIANQDALTDSIAGTGGAAKDAKKYLSGLDELATYADDSGGGGGGGGGIEYVEEAIEESGSWAEQIRDAIAGGDWRGVGALFAEKMNSIISNWDAGKTAQNISEKLRAAIQTAIGFVQTADWKGIGDKLEEFLRNADWSGIVSDTSELIGSVIGGIGEFLWGAIDDTVGDIGKFFKERIDKWAETYGADGNESGAAMAMAIVTGILEGFVDGLQDIDTWIHENIFTPFINGIKKAFGIKPGGNSYSAATEIVGRAASEGLFTADALGGVNGKFDTWFSENITPWFTFKKWDEKVFTPLGNRITWLKEQTLDKALNAVTSIGDWFSENVTPWFTYKKWEEKVFTPVKTRITWLKEQTLDKALNAVTSIEDWFSENITPWFTYKKWDEKVFTPIKTRIEYLKKKFSFGDFSPIKDWWNNNVAPWFTTSKWQELGRNAVDAIKKGLQNLPKFHLVFVTATKTFSVLGKTITMDIPWPQLSFYARGGIVDGATLFGNNVVGEAGKEAIIPLERHTEWIKMVAEEIVGFIKPDLFPAGYPRPVMATGTQIPPRVLCTFEGGYSLDDVIKRLDSLIQRQERPINFSGTFNAEVNGKTLFHEVISQGRTAQKSSGKNPFDF